MANTGAPWNLDYPVATDAPNGPAGIQALAEDAHAALGKAWPCLSTARPAHAAGRIIWETDTGLAQISDGTTWWPIAFGDDTGWLDAIAAGVTPATNMTLISGQIRRHNGVVGMYLTVSYTTGFSAGDIGNTLIVTLPGGFAPTASFIGGINGGGNGASLAAYVNSAGGVVLTAVNQTIAAGSTFNLTGTFLQ